MSNTGLKRKGNEKYYTSHAVVQKLLKPYNQIIKKNDTDLWIEPSAGNGSFTSYLGDRNLIAYDIAPEAPGIKQQNFLELDLDIWSIPLHFIGNPPFGRQSSIAIHFIKRITACDKTKSLAFILPKSFKKDSMKRYFPLNFHLEHEEDVEKDGFVMEGTQIDVPCVFQIWVKKDYEREKPVKLEPKGYKFTKKLHGRYALRRVGFRAGIILDMFVHSLSEISEQSHYFIKLDEGDEKFIDKYNNAINFEHNNTVGPKSISKQEFIQVLNKLF